MILDWRLCTSPYQAVFLDCTSPVLGVKNYLTELPHALLAGICLPNFSLSSCYHRQVYFFRRQVAWGPI